MSNTPIDNSFSQTGDKRSFLTHVDHRDKRSFPTHGGQTVHKIVRKHLRGRALKSGESEYHWGLEDEPGRAPKELGAYRVILVSKTSDVSLGEGPNEFLGECISRAADVKLPPLELC
jgi:hypothetical protein